MLPSRVSTHWNMLSGPPSPEQVKTACWVRLALMKDGVAATLPSGDTAQERDTHDSEHQYHYTALIYYSHYSPVTRDEVELTCTPSDTATH